MSWVCTKCQTENSDTVHFCTRPWCLQQNPSVPQAVTVYLRERLFDFAHVMEFKLRKNDHKTEWTKMPTELLLRRLQGEALELEIALQYETPEDAMKEAADVANFAFFIYDRLRKQLETQAAKDATRKSGPHQIGTPDA